jgi:phosphonoacetate hydrolase
MSARRFSCNGREYRAPGSRTLAICLDGTAREYLDRALDRGLMPHLAGALRSGGGVWMASAQMPTLTNVNNASIVTGVDAAAHGISGNHYLAADGRETQLTDARALRAETILAAAARAGVPTLAVTAKDKLRGLLGAGGVPAISAECAHEQTLAGLDGATGAELLAEAHPAIYDPALSAYTIALSLALARRLQAQLVYCSLTDYVQHKAAPGEPLADEFLAGIDERLGEALDGGWRVGIVADHGMNAKANADGSPAVRYLSDVLRAAGVAQARVLLPITDPYVVHHGALGSIAYVYVRAGDLPAARGALARLPGVEAVLDRDAAARVLALPADRIGELVVCADAATVLGKSEAEHDLSALGAGLRSHGGLHELDVPLVLCHALEHPALGSGHLRNADLFDVLLNGEPR